MFEIHPHEGPAPALENTDRYRPGAGGGLIALAFSGGAVFVTDWIKPFGTIFMNLLKLMAMPLIITSIIRGVGDLKSMSSLAMIGGRTFLWYVLTTFIAIAVGLAVVNIIRPGNFVKPETRQQLMQQFADEAEEEVALADASASGDGPWRSWCGSYRRTFSGRLIPTPICYR